IDALSTWIKPSVLDRVDGRYRGEISRAPEPVRDRAAQPLIQLISGNAKDLRLSAVRAVGKLRIEAASRHLFTRLESDPEPDVRAEALKSIAAMDDPQTGDAIKLAFADQTKSVRVVALDLLTKTNMERQAMVNLLSEASRTRTGAEKQAALTTLGSLGADHAGPVLDTLLTRLDSGDLSPEIHLELAEAIDSIGSPSLKSRYVEITKRLSPDSLKAAFNSVLAGGDVAKGRSLFFRDQTAQCMRCHSFNDFGGNAGPRLNGVHHAF